MITYHANDLGWQWEQQSFYVFQYWKGVYSPVGYGGVMVQRMNFAIDNAAKIPLNWFFVHE